VSTHKEIFLLFFILFFNQVVWALVARSSF